MRHVWISLCLKADQLRSVHMEQVRLPGKRMSSRSWSLLDQDYADSVQMERFFGPAGKVSVDGHCTTTYAVRLCKVFWVFSSKKHLNLTSKVLHYEHVYCGRKSGVKSVHNAEMIMQSLNVQIRYQEPGI